MIQATMARMGMGGSRIRIPWSVWEIGTGILRVSEIWSGEELEVEKKLSMVLSELDV
jgi:hypothetical protein